MSVKSSLDKYMSDDTEYNKKQIAASKSNGKQSEKIECDYSIKGKKMPLDAGY